MTDEATTPHGAEIDIGLRRGRFNLDVNLTLPERGITAILGPSGGGKSSLLRAIAGLERPHRGHVRMGGETWFDARRRVHLPPQKRRVGMVFQDYALFDHMSVFDNIGYGLPKARRADAAAYWMDRLHLEDLADRYPRQLSGGQKQRVALARALAPEPEMLLLDEPFSAVDQYLRQRLRAQLQGIVTGMTQPVLMVTHDLEEARQVADCIGVIVDGKLLRLGTTQEVFADPGCFEVARVLGWRNLLPVSTLTGRRVSGPWGAMDLCREPPTDTAWLAVSAEYPRVSGPRIAGGRAETDDPHHLHARLVRATELGAVRELQCRLDDGTPFFLQRPWNEPVPAPGSDVTVTIPSGRLRALPEGRVHLTPDEKPGLPEQAQPGLRTV
ncbi:MAG: ABC transporter ATP-binding protein [Gammaproteobacteria bacterium]